MTEMQHAENVNANAEMDAGNDEMVRKHEKRKCRKENKQTISNATKKCSIEGGEKKQYAPEEKWQNENGVPRKGVKCEGK